MLDGLTKVASNKLDRKAKIDKPGFKDILNNHNYINYIFK